MRCESLVESLQVLLAIYFVFNYTYPPSLASTFLFIEMYFLNISSEGETCRASNEKYKSKVLTFYKALGCINPEDFEKT